MSLPTPDHNSVVIHLKTHHKNDWTNEAEVDFKHLHEYILNLSIQYHTSSKRHSILQKSFRIAIFVASSANIITSSSSLDCAMKGWISLSTNLFSTSLLGIYSLLDFSKKFMIYRDIAIGLEALARKIQTELYKPPQQRVSPYQFMLMIETVQQKILKKELDIQ